MTTVQSGMASVPRTSKGAGSRPETKVIDLSIIIVSWNVREHLRACLDSIRRQRGDLETQVLIVDNASKDGTTVMIEAEYPWVELIANVENNGFAAANNQGLARAQGRFLLLLNPDTELNAACLRNTLDYAETHPELGVVGCRAYRQDGSQQSTMFRCLGLRDLLINMIVPNRIMRRFAWLGGARYLGADFDQPHEVEAVSGCFMLLPREVFEQAGGMDEGFFMYGEEAEWCHRIRRGGWKIGYFPGASILHHGGVSTEQCLDEMSRAMARSQLLLIQRTRGRPVASAANALMFLRDGSRALLWKLLSLVSRQRHHLNWNPLRNSVERFGIHARGLFRQDWSR